VTPEPTGVPPVFLLMVSPDMAKKKPLVNVACFCDTLIEDKDGVLSAIRIIDTFTLSVVSDPPGHGLPPGVSPVVDLTGLITLKAEEAFSTRIHLRLRRVNGEEKMLSPDDGWPVEFKGGSHGVTIRIKLQLAVQNYGVCWFDVLHEGEVLTSIPLRLVQADAQKQSE